MNKPHWETKHDWWEEDFAFMLYFRNQLCDMLIRHPDDSMGKSFREMAQGIDKKISCMQVEYRKIYGKRYNLNNLKGRKFWFHYASILHPTK